MKISLLGGGMLSSTVFEYLTDQGYEVKRVNGYWPSKEFKSELEGLDGFVINGIGAIPQRTNDFRVNYELPEFLGSLPNIKVIQPGTDCEEDLSAYGVSKFTGTAVCAEFDHIKSIKTSIIGFDRDRVSLLSWALDQEGPVDGYVDAYWDGVTTLKWAEKCLDLIQNWEKFEKVTVISSNCISKYDLLKTIYKVFGHEVEVNPVSGKGKNKCLVGEYVGEIEEMLEELKEFYYGPDGIKG